MYASKSRDVYGVCATIGAFTSTDEEIVRFVSCSPPWSPGSAIEVTGSFKLLTTDGNEIDGEYVTTGTLRDKRASRRELMTRLGNAPINSATVIASRRFSGFPLTVLLRLGKATGSGVESLRQALRRKIVARAPAQLAATLSMVLEMEQSARSAPRTEPRLHASAWVERRFQSSDGKSRSLPMMRPEKRPFEEPPATLAGQGWDTTIVNK